MKTHAASRTCGLAAGNSGAACRDAVLADNPTGTLAHRDEIITLIKHLDREEQVQARGFYLTAWNGNSGYKFHRVVRGKIYIEALCLSFLGSAQPSNLSAYIRNVHATGAGGDGLIQRFSLLVWPDQTPVWRNIDRYPDSEAKTDAWNTFERLDQMTGASVKAAVDKFETLPFLRFDGLAQTVFDEWHGEIEGRLRTTSREISGPCPEAGAHQPSR